MRYARGMLAGLLCVLAQAHAGELPERTLSLTDTHALEARLQYGDVLPLRLEVPADRTLLVRARSPAVDIEFDVQDGDDTYSSASPAHLAGTEFLAFAAAPEARTVALRLRLSGNEGGAGAVAVRVFEDGGVEGTIARAWARISRGFDGPGSDAASHARIVALEGLLATCTAIADARCMADARLALGALYEAVGRIDETQAMYGAAIDGFVALESGLGEIAARIGFATRLYYSGETADAEAIYARCSALAREHGLTFLEAQYENYVAVMRQYAGDLDAALEHYARAQGVLGNLRLPIAVQMRDNIGGVYELQGDAERAMAAYQDAIDFAGDDPALRIARANAVSNLGALKATLDQTQDAIALLSESLEVFREAEATDSHSRVLGILAYQYQLLGRFSLAEPLLRNAVAMCGTQSNMRCLAVAWRNLAVMLAGQRRTAEAADAFARAQEFTAKANSTYTSAMFYNEAIDFYLAQGKLSEVKAALDAMAANEGIAAMKNQQTRMRLRRGRLLVAQHEDASARAEFEAILAADDGSVFDSSMLLARLELARLDARAQDWAAVERRVNADLQSIASVRQEFFDPLLRADFLATRQESFELLIDAKLARHRTGDANALRDAFDVEERSRSRALLDALAETEASSRAGDPALLAARDTLRVKQLALTRFAASATQDDTARLDAMRADVALARVALDARERAAGKGDEAPLGRTSGIDAVQAMLQSEHQAILMYRVRTTRSWLWVVTRDSLRLVDLPPRDALLPRIERFVQDARGDGRDPHGDGRWLHDTLIGAAGLGADRTQLLIVPDGPLQQLPFVALRAPDERYLVESVQLSLLPSTSVAVALRDRANAPRSYPEQDVVVFADPVFDHDDVRLRSVAAPADPATRAAMYAPLPRLPGTAREAKAMQEAFGAQRVRVFDGFAASLEAARGDAARTARILHFATHGIVDPAAPELTGLAMSRLRADGRAVAGDGFFNLPLIGESRFAAELVILSACESALGRDIESEGLIGLSRSFLASGAGGVVATLWPVSDRHAAQLEGRFAAALRDGHATAHALAVAQREAIADPARRRPRSWAAFGYYGPL